MPLRIQLAAIMGRSRSPIFAGPLDHFAGRLAPYGDMEFPIYDSEHALFEAVVRQRSRAASHVVLLDSRGKSFSSEDLAAWLQRERDGGRQSFLFAIGPASGWSAEARARADLLLSLGPMTLPHELARLVLVEQVYRAFTIMAGHPYHLSH